MDPSPNQDSSASAAAQRARLIQSLASGISDADEEQEILTVLQQAPVGEFAATLQSLDLDELFETVDNRLVGPDNRTRLLQLVCRERRAELSIDLQAQVIHALQTGRTGGVEQDAIIDMFCALSGPELLELKNRINSWTDQHDLEGLVFVDIDADRRQRLLDHFAAEATENRLADVKVLSDIDDTVFARIHDDRYPKGTLYPGLLAFYRALDDGPLDQPTSTGDLTFVTARPMDVLGLLENHTREVLRAAGIAHLSVMSGSWAHVLTNSAMAAKKLTNIEHYRAIYPEYGMVFMGDSGQGDPIVADELRREWPEADIPCFIHDVVNTPEDVKAAATARNIHYVDTYVGAARIARQLGLISASSLAEVISEAQAGVDAVAWDKGGDQALIRSLLARDIELANG